MKQQNSISEALAAWKVWFTLGIGVKRWLVILGLGAVIAGTGIGAFIVALGNRHILPESFYGLLTLEFLPLWLRILLPLLVGGLIIFLAIVRLGSNLVAPFRRPGQDVAASLQSYSFLGRGPRIVAIGGGTGLPALLRGLTSYTSNITAIVTVADDGGSSGRLRRELGVLPPGDFRNNIAALARDESLMTQLLQYRFGGNVSTTEKGELQGHAFGNLLLASLTGITGSFDEALGSVERVLAMNGRVLPSTLENVTLVAEVEVDASTGESISGESSRSIRRIIGESAITKAGGRVKRIALEPAKVPAYPAAVQAILQADLVVIGPGSLYTSILPNLLVQDISSALQYTRAIRIYACNLATQPGETDNYTVADHVQAIDRHLPREDRARNGWVDVILANENLSIPPEIGGGQTVFVQPSEPATAKLVTRDLVDEQQPWRHDSEKLAEAVIALLNEAE
jgi:uncharacterized cofD-like protein